MQLPVDTNRSDRSDVIKIASATVASDGTALVVFDPVPPGYYWLVYRLMILGAGAGTVFVYDDPARPDSSILDGSTAGAFDSAEYPQGMQLDQTKTLCMAWTGATAGNTITVRAQLRVMPLS